MRKRIRSILRAEAERHHVKPSKFVANAWHRYQVNRVGWTGRRINQAKGTAPKRLWASRIRAVLE